MKGFHASISKQTQKNAQVVEGRHSASRMIIFWQSKVAGKSPITASFNSHRIHVCYTVYGNIYHQYTPNVSIYTILGSYGIGKIIYKWWIFHCHV